MASRHVNWSERMRSNQFIPAAPRLNAECKMQNAEDLVGHFAFCILHFAFGSPPNLDSVEDFEKIDRLANVVHAHDRSAAARGRRDRGE